MIWCYKINKTQLTRERKIENTFDFFMDDDSRCKINHWMMLQHFYVLLFFVFISSSLTSLSSSWIFMVILWLLILNLFFLFRIHIRNIQDEFSCPFVCLDLYDILLLNRNILYLKCAQVNKFTSTKFSYIFIFQVCYWPNVFYHVKAFVWNVSTGTSSVKFLLKSKINKILNKKLAT